MAFMGEQAVSDGVTLSDSLTRTRPEFLTYMRSDANAKGNDVAQIEQRRLERQMKMPSLVGRRDIDSFKAPQNPSDPAFRKYNDEGDYRPPAPFRASDNIIDPVCGFVSVAGDKARNTGHTRVVSMVQLNDTPQSYNPRELHSIRMNESAPPDTRRESDRDPGAPYPWNGRKMLDATIRSNLGGRYMHFNKQNNIAVLVMGASRVCKACTCTHPWNLKMMTSGVITRYNALKMLFAPIAFVLNTLKSSLNLEISFSTLSFCLRHTKLMLML